MTRRLANWIWVSLCLLAMVAPLRAAVRINEIMFDPDGGNSPDLEFIELYNDGVGSVDLLNWDLLVDGVLLKKIGASYVLGAGSYVTLYIGSPVGPPPQSIALGFATEQLGDSAGEILLTDDSSTPVDYIAYGSVVSNPPVPLVFPTPILLTYWQTGDSLAFIQPDGVNADDPGQWLNRRSASITVGSENTQQPEPTLSYGTITVPATFPLVNSCEEIVVPIAVAYSHETPIFNASVEMVIPAGFLFIFGAGGTFNDTTRTVSWDLGTLDGNRSLTLRLWPNCTVTQGEFAPSALTLEFGRYDAQTPLIGVSSTNGSGVFTVDIPVLNVEMGKYLTGARTVITSLGTMVEFQIVVTNNGTGRLGRDGAELGLTLASNLTLIGFRQTGPLGPPLLNLVMNPTSGIFTCSTGALDPGESRTFYVKALSVGCALAFGCAKADLFWGCADALPGSQSCTVTTGSGASVFCPPTLTFEVPAGQPSIYSGCQNVVRRIVVTNPNGVPFKPQGLDIALPPGYYWISSQIGASAVGTYNQGAKTLNFTTAELTGGTGEIAGNSTVTIELVMRPSCVAGNERVLSGVLIYEINCPLSGPYISSVIGQSSPLKLNQPALAVAVQDPANPSQTTVLAERGEIVTFKVVVINNGLGDLDTDGKPAGAEGGWLELGTVGAGLSLQSVRDISGGLPGTVVIPTGSPPRWPTGAMAAGTDKSYLVEFLVVACENVNYDIETYWTCAGTDPLDTCRQDGESKGSVNILLRNPKLTLAPLPFEVNYCQGVTVTIPISNAAGLSIGAARNVTVSMLGMNLEHYTLTPGVGSAFAVSTAGNVATFTLNAGDDSDLDGDADDIRRGNTYNIVFDVNITPGICNSEGGALLIFQPYYEDSCGIPYTAGTQLSSYSRTNREAVGLSKSGPDVSRVGETGLTWTINMTYTGTPGATLQYTLVDNYPDVVNNPPGNFTIVSFADRSGTLTSGVDYTDNGDTIERTVNAVFDVDGNYSETFTIVFDAPNTVCAGGRIYTNNAGVTIAAPLDPVDCNDCAIPSTFTASSSITLNNREEDDIDQHNRRVRYLNLNVHGLDNSAYQSSGETCTDLVFDHLIRFKTASPNAWKVDVGVNPVVDIRPIRFRDDLDQRLQAPGGNKQNMNVEIYYFAGGWEPGTPSGSDYGPNGTALIGWSDITYVAPTVGTDGYFEINLGGLDAIAGGGPTVPSDGGILWIRYTVKSQAVTAGGFTDFAKLIVPLSGGAPCNPAEPETEYYHLVNVSITDPVATVAIANMSSPSSLHIDRCETVTLRFSLGSGGRPFDVYDARLVVDLAGNYRYLSGSTVFGGSLQDEGGFAFTAFEPAESGTTLAWNLGDLRDLAGAGGNRYIEIDVQKICDDSSTVVSASVFNNNMCNQVADANGPNAATTQDTVIAALSSFDNSATASYQPQLYSGRLETRFASGRVYYNDGYPTALLHVVNSGNGTLHNVRVPIELGSILNGTSTLTFVTAHVTAISGVTSEVVDLVNPIIPVELGTLGPHGYRELTLGIDTMAPSSIITIRLQLRMVLCADLTLRIVQSHWGCPPGKDDACPVNLLAPELNSTMEIRSGNARALVIGHSADPGVIDLCGSLTRISIEVLNAGSVDVYEPSIRERLPEGMQIVPDSVKYRINSGPLLPFPEASGGGLRYTQLTTATTPGIGDYQTVLWVLTDPNSDGSESDSLLSGTEFNDPYPTDPYFERHRVMKPAHKIYIEFDALLSGCSQALAYKNGNRRAEATLLFDLPCHHDDRINPDGTAVAGGSRPPLDDNTRESTFLDPGTATVVIDLQGQNVTQSGPATFSQVNGELNDTLEWTVKLDSLGPGVVPEPILEIFIPSILTVDFATHPPVIASPANLVFVDTNPVGVPQANPAGTTYVFAFRNTDPGMIAANREYYFAADEEVIVNFISTINFCTVEKPIVQAKISWGCCKETAGMESANGMDQSSTALKTKPDSPTIVITEGDGAALTQFDSCLGAYTITLTNPGTNNELSLRQIDVRLTLPDGWVYAPMVGDGTDFLYLGPGARAAGDQLTADEEEPLIVGNVLRWTSLTRSGKIDDNRARLFPLERLKIIVYLRADGTGVNCDLDGQTNPSVPSFTQPVEFANYQDSCGDSLDSPKITALQVNPEHPVLNISLVPNTRFIGSATTIVTWELRIQNAGDKIANDVVLDLDFGDGYSNVTLTGGTPTPAQTGNVFAWALGSIAPLAPAGTMLWTFTGTIDTTNRDDLSGKAVVRGNCRERDNSLGCTYSFAETDEYITGASISKVIDGTRLSLPAVSTDPGPNAPNATAADVTIGTIIRHLVAVNIYEGGENNIIVRDVLPAGLEFLEANLVNQTGVLIASITPTSNTGNILVFSHTTIAQFANIIGGRLGANAIFLEIWVQVRDNTSLNVEDGVLENTAQLTVIRGNQEFDHTTVGLTLYDASTLTIREPFIRDDASLTKISVPSSLPANHVGTPLDIEPRPAGDNPVAYTFTAKNTGTSPAYELEFTDLVPWQFEDPTLLVAPYELAVTITPSAGPPARVLVKNTDYTLSWTAGASSAPGTLKVNLLVTAAAVLDLNETITFSYHGKVETFAPGTFVDNSGDLTGYSSLPGVGATLVTARSTNLLENGAERISYGVAYRNVPVKRTYHKFSAELIASGLIIAEITPLSNNSPPDFRDDGSTRATIGEQVAYWVRLSLPQLITLHDLAFSLDIPDGLTVRSADWEIVPVGADFSGAEKNLSFSQLGTGITQVRGVGGAGGDDFPQPLTNNTGIDQEMLVKVLFTVDRTYNGGSAVAAGNVFNLPATFTWSTGSDSTDPIPAFTVVDPDLSSLTKARSAHLQSDNATPAVSPGTGTYHNYNAIGPDNAGSATDPVANVYQVRPGDIVEYTVTFRNDGDAAAWNIQLRDTIPAGMTLRPGSRTIVTNPVDAGISISDPVAAAVVTFDINRVLPGHAVTVIYRCDIDTTVAVGRYLQNQVDIVQYSSLPEAPFNPPGMPAVAWPGEDRSVTSGAPDQYAALGPAFEKVGTEFPTSAKTVESEITAPAGKLKDGSSRATIGEVMTYEIRLDIPDTAVFYDLALSDIVPDGLTVQSAVYSINAAPAVALDAVANPNGTTTVVATANPFGDVAGQAGINDEIVITITATVDQTFISATGATDNGPFGVGGANGVVDAGDIFANNATFTWNQVNGEVTSNSQSVELAPVTFTIIEPRLETLTKAKASVTPAAFSGPGDGYHNYNTVGPNPNNAGPVNSVDQVIPGHIVLYTVTLTNNGNATAYDIDLTDDIPEGMSYVPGSATILAGPNPSTIAFRSVPTAPVLPSRSLEFELNYLEPGNTATLTYRLQVDIPVGGGRFLLNQVNLADYRSLPSTAAYPAAARDTNAPAPNYGRLGPALTYAGTFFATATKTVASELSLPSGKLADGSARGTIGEVMTYEVLIDIPDNIILYDLLVQDIIPANLTVRSQNLVPADITYAEVNNNGTVTTYGTAAPQLTVVGNTVGLYLGSDVRAQNGVANEIRVVIAVTVDDVAANVTGTVFENMVTASWNQVDENPGTPAGRNSLNAFTTPDPAALPDSVDFTIIQPIFVANTLTKTLSGHYLADGGTVAASPGTASYRNYNLAGPVSHLAALDPVPNVYQVRPTEILQYTVTFVNTGNARAYDIALTDTVPVGLTLVTAGVNAPTVTGGTTVGIAFINSTPTQPGGSGTPINFVVNWLDPGQTCTMTFRTQIESDIGTGAYLQNRMTMTDFGTTPDATAVFPLLERDTTSAVPYVDPNPKFEKVGTEYPVSSKTVESEITAPTGKLKDGSSRATIGEVMTYELRFDLPDTTVCHDLLFTDVVPDGVTVRSAAYSINAGPSAALDIVPNPNGTTTVTATTSPFGDVAGQTGVNDEIVITITATVDQTFVSATGATDNGPFSAGGSNGIVDAGDIFANNATFTWNQVNNVVTANIQNAEPAPITFTILEPRLETLTKAKASVTPAAFSGPANGYRNYNAVGPNPNNAGLVNNVDQVIPGHIVLYTVTVTNNGNAMAYDIDLTDGIPEGMSYVPGSATILAGPNPSTIAFRSVPTAPVLPSRSLEFELNYLEPGNTATLTYRLQVDIPVGGGRFLLNQINLADYRSLPSTAAYPAAARDTNAPAPNYGRLGPALTYAGTFFPTATKTVTSEFSLPSGKLADGSARGTIGEVMTYEVLIDIPDNIILYDLLIQDIIPANLTVRSQDLVPADITYAVVNNNGTVTAYGSVAPQLAIVSNTVGLYLESDVRAQNGVANEIRVVMAVTVNDVAANVTGTVFKNKVTTSWNQVDENPGTPAGRNIVNNFITPNPAATPDSVDFTIIQPIFVANTLTKTRSGHYLADGSTVAVSPGTATYRNYNPAGPVSHLTALDPVPNVYQVRPTEILQYTVTFVNTGNARAYDIALTDDVPAGFTLLTAAPNAPTVMGGTTAGIAFINSTPTQPGGSGTPINFVVNWLDPGQTCTMTFRTRIEPGIGAGAYLQNKMTLIDFGTTSDATAVFPLLERDTTSTVPYVDPNPKFEKVGSEYPVTSKTVQTELTPPSGKLKDGSSRATIGELVTYEILLDIKNDLILFDVNFSDMLPDGLTAVAASYSISAGASVPLTLAIQGNGTTLATDTATPLGDVAAVAAQSNEIVLTITATVDQTFVSATGATDNGPFGVGGANGVVDAGDIFANNATFTWNQVNNVGTANIQNAEPAAIALTIVEPNLGSSFAKNIVRILDTDGSSVVTTTRGHTGPVSAGLIPAAVNGKTSYFRYPTAGGNPTQIDNVQVVLPEDYVEYSISVTNSGNARAFDVKIRDILPPVATVSYTSGVGTFALAAVPYTAGSVGSELEVASSTVNVDSLDRTQLDFTIDMLGAGATATITYRVRVLQGVGAGHYIGLNVATLRDVGSLPDGTFTVPVGNLAAGNGVFANDRERDTTSTPAYATQGPVGDDIGVQYPEFATRVYRRYNVDGNLTDTLLAANTNLRIGDILIYEMVATLPRYTTLFDGGISGNAMAFRHRLNRGYHVIAGTEQFNTGTIDLTTLHKVGSPTLPFAVISNQQYPTWSFTDIANSTNTSQTATLRFQAEVKNTDYNGVPYFTDQTASVGLVNRSYLFWNTADRVEKATLSNSTAINTGDHPFLQRDSFTTSVVQPNLLLSKTSIPVPDSFIGVNTAVGDTVTYTLTLRNWDSATAGSYRGRGTAYSVLLNDVLPKDLAPIAPAEPTLTAAVHSINTVTGATTGLLRTLVRNSDYTYAYLFDPVSKQGAITIETVRDIANSDYDSRIDVNTALVITYQISVNPDIGAQGSGAGQRVNQALLNEYYSFPEAINDLSRKQYGPEGPRRVSLLTEVPSITKTSPNANDSVLPGGVVEYTLLAPKDIIGANLYEVEFRDTIPDGLSFGGNGTVSGVGPGPVSLNVGDAVGQVPGNEVVVTGGTGAVTITITNRELIVTVARIDAEGGNDQVRVDLKTVVQTSFDNGAPIARLHEFINTASLLWYDDDNTFPERSRYATISPTVSHFFDARGILFEPSHTGTAQPGTIRIYRHVLRNFEDGAISIPIDFSATQPSWVWQLFLGDGEGNMISGPFETGYSVAVPANGVTEVIMRAFVPTEITSFTTDVLTIKANGALDNIITVTDVTVVQVERIAVLKDISTTGDYETRLEVLPDQANAINQRIRFTNNGQQDVKEIFIYDFIPEYTAYIANSAVNTAELGVQYSKDGGVTWIPGEPATNGETVVNGMVPTVTNLRWYFDAGGVLVPGLEKTITFQIRIK